jgi:flagellin-like protein
MQRIQPMRLMAMLALLGALLAIGSTQVASAVQPLEKAQTTSSVSSKAFLATPAPDLVGAPASTSDASATTPLAPVRTGLLSPVVGAVVLVLVVLVAGGLLLWRRRGMSGA